MGEIKSYKPNDKCYIQLFFLGFEWLERWAACSLMIWQWWREREHYSISIVSLCVSRIYVINLQPKNHLGDSFELQMVDRYYCNIY